MPRILDLDRRAVDPDLAAVLAVGAAEDLHQRRLAGAVLAEQHVDFAAVQRQIDTIERNHTRKRLPDAAHLEHRRHRTLCSNGGPPGISMCSPCHCVSLGPGAKRSFNANMVLMRVSRDGVSTGLSLRGNAK